MEVQTHLSTTQDSLFSFLNRLSDTLDMLNDGITDEASHSQVKIEVQTLVETLMKVKADLHTAIDTLPAVAN